MKKTILFLSILFNILMFSQNSSDIDPDFNNFNLPINNKFFDESIIKHIVLPDGKIIILTLTDIYKLDGNNVDNSLNVDGFTPHITNDSFRLNDCIVQTDGKIIVSGVFSKYKNISRKNLLRLNTDGSLDLTFNALLYSDGQNSNAQLKLLNDGKILLSDDNITFSGFSNFKKINSDGTIDTSFTPLINHSYGSFTILNDGSILVSRSQNQYDTIMKVIVKLNSNGIIDTGFNIPIFSFPVGGQPILKKIHVTDDNKILVGGRFTGCNSTSRKDLARLNADGSLDTTFNVGTGFSTGTSYEFLNVRDIDEYSDGKIIVVGEFNFYNGTSRKKIVKLNTDGTIDFTFSTQDNFLNISEVNNVTVINNQKLFITGNYHIANKSDDFISIINVDGTKDLSFHNKCKGFYSSTLSNANNVNKVFAGTNNKLLVGGSFKSYNGEKCIAFTKLNLDGTIDNTFNYNGLIGFDENSPYNNVQCILENTNGSIYLGGSFSKFNNANVGNLILVNSNGTLNTSFNIVTSGFKSGSELGLVNAVLTRPDGKILVGGYFDYFNNNGVSGLVILNSNGTYFSQYIVGSYVNSIIYQNDGKLLVGQDDDDLIRFLANSTTVDASFIFDSNITSSSISSIKIQADGKIYIQGDFTVNGLSKSLLRLNSNGSIDSTFDLSFQNATFSIKSFNLLPNNKILILEGLPSNYKIERLNYNGTLDLDFDYIMFSNPNDNINIESLILSNGNIFIYGNYLVRDGISRGLFKIFGNEYSYLKSKIRYDLDNNLCDINDLPLNNIKFNIMDANNSSNNYSMSSDAIGEINLGFENGQYNVSAQFENPSYFTVSPPNVVVDFPTQVSPVIQDFCVAPNGIHHDVEVSILPTNVARPGFDANYKIIYKNKGNQTENGVVSLQFNDDVLDLVSTNPAFTSQTINNLTFNYSNLQPFETREIIVVFNVNSPMESPAVNSGDILNYTVSNTIANTDEMLSDNTFVLNQTVVNSYDPNDKTCLQGNYVGPDKVGEYVHYMIRFENTGTFPAENIVVKDMIDTAKFDVSSLVPLHASHNYITKIAGNKIEFIFENINLPFDDANNDGYIAFKIKTVPTLVVGNTFSNWVSIYFDYNFPIVTNTATTTIAALSNPSFEFATYFSLYPNPTKGELNINLKSAIEINSIQIYNTIGQLLTVQTGNALKVDVSNLKTGNYFIKINTNEGFSTSQFIKE